MKAGDVVMVNGRLEIVSLVKKKQVQGKNDFDYREFVNFVGTTYDYPAECLTAIGNLQNLFLNRDPVLCGVCK